MQYEFIATPYQHSLHFKFFLDQEQEIQPLVQAKIMTLAVTPEPQYAIPDGTPADATAIRKHFGAQLYREILQEVVSHTVNQVIALEQLHPCTVLAIELMAAEDHRLKYFCALAKLPPVKEIAAQIHVIKPTLTITDACIAGYLELQRVSASPADDARLLNYGETLATFDIIRCLVVATNIPRYLNTSDFSCLLGAEQEYFAIEQQLSGKQLQDTSYTLITPLGEITLLICQARRLNRILSLTELQQLLPPHAQPDLTAYARITLKKDAAKPSHVYMVTTIMQQLENLTAIDICPQMLKKYTEQPPSQSLAQDRTYYLQAVAHLFLYCHLPQEAGELFSQALATITPQTLIDLGYLTAEAQHDPATLRLRQTLYQSLQYLAQDVRYEEKMMSLRDFYHALATMTTSTYR